LANCFWPPTRKACGWLALKAASRAAPVQPEWKEDKAPFAEVIRQLHAYFGGELREFDLPMAAEGSEFQLRV